MISGFRKHSHTYLCKQCIMSSFGCHNQLWHFIVFETSDTNIGTCVIHGWGESRQDMVGFNQAYLLHPLLNLPCSQSRSAPDHAGPGSKFLLSPNQQRPVEFSLCNVLTFFLSCPCLPVNAGSIPNKLAITCLIVKSCQFCFQVQLEQSQH